MLISKLNVKTLKTSGFNLIFLISLCLLYWQLSKLGYLVPISDLPEVMLTTDNNTLLHKKLPDQQLLNYHRNIPEIIGTTNYENIDKNKISILVEKTRYRLTVYYDKQPIKTYPIVLGANPIDDKRKEGDKRTPEGRFKLKDIYPHPDWSKFLWVNYPTANSWRKHFQSKLNGEIKWYDSIGGEIGIHGVPIKGDYLIDDRQNWTWGCPSLKTKDIEELYKVVQIGTEVEIIK